MTEITTLEQLRAIMGEPLPRVRDKDRTTFTAEHRAFIAASPLCLVSTSGVDGSCDVSPKGDPPGSFLVVDDTTVALAERPGNRRADGFENIVANPHVGLLFLVPGRGDTLRVNGRARLLTGAPYAERLQVGERRPALVVEVLAEQIFFHCSKAFLRSQLWEPDTWRPDAAPGRAEIAHALERSDQALEDVQAYYASPDYGQDLY